MFITRFKGKDLPIQFGNLDLVLMNSRILNSIQVGNVAIDRHGVLTDSHELTIETSSIHGSVYTFKIESIRHI